MSWNMTARATSVRTFSSGGARGTVGSMDTSQLFNSMTGSMFAGELKQAMEHFEPYGLTAAIINKNASGVAEAVMHFLSGARGHAIAGVVGDRRYRPLGLQQGENVQYDDIGQMTLLRRAGTFLLTLDGMGGADEETPGSNQNRMMSLRHVMKDKQPRTPMSGGPQGGGEGQTSASPEEAGQFKHEGQQVNTEIRLTAQLIQICDGETAVAVYDRQAMSWSFYAQDFNFNAQNKVNILANGIIEIDSQAMTKINGGGQIVQPFTVSPGGMAPQSAPQAQGPSQSQS